MRPRALGVATLTLLAFLLVSTSAFADRPAPEVTPYEPGPFESVTPGPPLPNGPCTMGINGAPAFNVNYLLDALSALRDTEIVLQLRDANSSALVREAGSVKCRHVVMPLRL